MGSGSSSYSDQNDHNDHNDHNNRNDLLELFKVAKNCGAIMSDTPDAVKKAIVKAVKIEALPELIDQAREAETSGHEFGSTSTDINTIMGALNDNALPGLLDTVRKSCPTNQCYIKYGATTSELNYSNVDEKDLPLCTEYGGTLDKNKRICTLHVPAVKLCYEYSATGHQTVDCNPTVPKCGSSQELTIRSPSTIQNTPS